MQTHLVALAADLGGDGKGSIETTVAVTGAVVVAALLVISIATGVAGRGKPLIWLALAGLALVATVALLSFV